MPKDIIPIFVCCSIALLLGGWSFLGCYFFFGKIRPLFYALCALVILIDLYFAPFYFVGIVLMIASTIVAIFGSLIHTLLNKKYPLTKDSYFSFFGLHYVASQLPILILLGIDFFGPSSIVDLYNKPLRGSWIPPLLLYLGPSVSVIPLYMFKTYRPRPGIDTHFPDAGNN